MGFEGSRRRLLRVLTTTALVAPLPLSVAAADWYDPDWTYRKRITIDATRVVNTDQSDFPVLMAETDSDWRHTASGGHVGRPNGGDLLFTASDGVTKLAHDLERYDGTTGEVIAWIEVPTLSATTDTDLYVYYGNAASPDQPDTSGTWSNGYVAVWHLNEDPTSAAPQMRDRTGNDHHGTVEAITTPSTVAVSGKVGNGYRFDGTDDLVRVLDSPLLDGINDAATIELWVNWTDSADGDWQILMTSSNRFDAGSEDGYEWASQASGHHFFYPWGGDPANNYNLGPNPFTDGQDHHLVLTMDYATKAVEIYVDGAPMSFSYVGVPTFWTQLASSDDWLWAGNPDRSTRYFSGVLDELRVSDVVRSADRIQTSFNNQDQPGTFYSIGAEEEHLALVKRAFTLDGTPIANASDVARGGLFKFLIYVNNRAGAVIDASARDSLDATFEYQAGTARVSNAVDSCVDPLCTAVEEAAIFANVDALAPSTDAEDGDVVSVTSGVIDAGNRYTGNARLDLAAGKVWAILFTVRVR